MALTRISSKQQLEFGDGRDEDDNMQLRAENASENDDEDLKELREVPIAREKPGRSLGSPVRRVGKKQRTKSIAQKKQPIAPVMGYYKTVAKLFKPGDFPMARVPHMLIEVKEDDAELRMGKIRVIGEVWCDGTVIHGEGGLKKRGRQLHTIPDSNQNIGIEAMGCLGGGFISATLKPTVIGSCFSVCRVDPRLEEEKQGKEEEEDEGEEECQPLPPMKVGTKEGDILCKLTVGSINRNQKKPDVQTHLMRLLPLSVVTKLNDQGIPYEVFKAESADTPAQHLSKVVQCLGMVVDGL